SHESIAPMPDAPAYQVPPPGPGETTPYGQPPGHSLGHSPASTPADYQLPPDPLGGDAGTHSYGIDPQYQPQPQQQYGTEQYQAAQYPSELGQDQYGTDQLGTGQYGTEQLGTGQYGTEQLNTGQYGTEQFGTEPQAYGVEVDGFGWDTGGAAAEAVPQPQVSPAATVRPPGEGLDRYAQLSYTSYDRPGQQGGWSVKEVLGDL